MNINIRNFNPRNIKLGTTIVISGKRGAGKSTIVKIISYYLSPKIRMALLVSNTADKKRDFEQIIPPFLIFEQYQSSIFKNFIKNQSEFCEKYRKNNTVKKHGLIIMDDVLAQTKKWKNDESLIEIFLEGRHSNITNILSIQDILGVPSSLRNNIDYLFITKEFRKERKKLIFDTFWPNNYGNYELFEKILMKCTEGYSTFVIDIKRTEKPNATLENTIFRWKPPDPKKIPPFKIGTRDLWNLNYKSYDEKWRIRKWGSVANIEDENDEIVQIHLQNQNGGFSK